MIIFIRTRVYFTQIVKCANRFECAPRKKHLVFVSLAGNSIFGRNWLWAAISQEECMVAETCFVKNNVLWMVKLCRSCWSFRKWFSVFSRLHSGLGTTTGPTQQPERSYSRSSVHAQYTAGFLFFLFSLQMSQVNVSSLKVDVSTLLIIWFIIALKSCNCSVYLLEALFIRVSPKMSFFFPCLIKERMSVVSRTIKLERFST